MKSLVIFYSQTGNTKKIAQAIGEGIKKRTGQCDVKSLRDVKPGDWLDYDLVGIGSCVWSSSPITNVIWHIKELPEGVRGKHAFFFCTHGILPGRCIIRGVQPMQEKGLTVLGWKDWYGQASVPGHGKPWYSDGHPDEYDLEEARAFGEAMVRHSEKVSAGRTDIIPKLHSKEASDEIYGVGHPFIFKAEDMPPMPEGPAGEAELEEPYILPYPTTMDYVCMIEGIDNVERGRGRRSEKLRINAEKCIGCHRCVQACWCGNIDGSTRVPTIRSNNCELCLFCEGVCPTGALEFNFRKPDPEMASRPGMSTELDLAEAVGRFRRILPEEEVSILTPWETVTGHPRHKEIP